MKKLIFNSSLPHSGSELLQVLLHQNPRIHGGTTSALHEFLFGARNNAAGQEARSMGVDGRNKAFNGFCRSGAQGFYEAITERPVVIDKSRGWMHYYEWLNQWNPNPKVVIMVRDLRDILAHLERVYRNTRHLPIGPDNPSEMTGLGVVDRINKWLNSQPLGISLKCLRDAFDRGVAQKCLIVRYEELLIDPSGTMSRIYEYIEEDAFEHDFQNIKKEVFENDSVFGPYGSHSVKPQLEKYRQKKWADVFSDEVGQYITDNCKPYFKTLGYI